MREPLKKLFPWQYWGEPETAPPRRKGQYKNGFKLRDKVYFPVDIEEAQVLWAVGQDQNLKPEHFLSIPSSILGWTLIFQRLAQLPSTPKKPQIGARTQDTDPNSPSNFFDLETPH